MHSKKIIVVIATLLISFFRSGAQDQRIADSLKIIYYTRPTTDSVRLNLLLDLSFNEIEDLNLALQYADELIRLSAKVRNVAHSRAGYFLKGTKLRLLTRLDEAQAAFFESAELAKKMRSSTAEADSYGGIASVYAVSGNHDNAVEYYKKAIGLLRSDKKPYNLAAVLSNLGDEFLRVKLYDSALVYFQNSSKIFDSIGYKSEKAYSMGSIGIVYANTGKKESAETYLNNAILILEANHDFYPVCEFLISMSQVYLEKGQLQTALQYAHKSLGLAEHYNLDEQRRDAFLKLSKIYEQANNTITALDNYQKYVGMKDSIDSRSSERKMYNLRSKFDNAQKQAEIDRSNRLNNLYKIMLFSSLGIVLFIAALIVILLRNYRQKQKAYSLLNEQKNLIQQQRDQTNKALQELQLTQTQLIHRERMASLGELTAGIAHEIQNPLNFVNNFSDVNAELLDEAQKELQNGNVNEAASILNGIKENEQKINHHGKRAESIVKGMMQHSRPSAGQKELTDINALASEYLKLSYHGLGAKDKSFNATMITNFDASNPKINITAQDVGRLLLNLYNNAFYAVNEKTASLHSSGQAHSAQATSLHSLGQAGSAGQPYQPTVSVSTKEANNYLEIRVKDNGNGIPQKILDKIFNPFFTTKPTGQGTGLGLSLSYDIVKAHGGTIDAETQEGEFAEFIIRLPLNG